MNHINGISLPFDTSNPTYVKLLELARQLYEQNQEIKKIIKTAESLKQEIHAILRHSNPDLKIKVWLPLPRACIHRLYVRAYVPDPTESPDNPDCYAGINLRTLTQTTRNTVQTKIAALLGLLSPFPLTQLSMGKTQSAWTQLARVALYQLGKNVERGQQKNRARTRAGNKQRQDQGKTHIQGDTPHE